nr:hypothetical protein [Tanacetum cinerariifolium]
ANCASFVLGWMMKGRGSRVLWWRSSRKRGKWSCGNGGYGLLRTYKDPEFPAKVYKVEKAMYGLHQAPRAWQRGDFILVQVYVDDIIFGSSNQQLCREFEALMHEKFQMSAMGELNFFLNLQDVRSSNTPLDKENPWGRDRIGKDVDHHLYRSMIGSLIYITASGPDIMFAICACARHQVTPKECHLHTVKKIFRYLKGHPKLRLWYPKESPFDLVAYSDSDYGGATQDRKSTTEGWDEEEEYNFVNKYFQEEHVEEESLAVYDTDNKEEVSMPVYDTDIEDVIEEEEGFVGKGGFGEEEDNIEDIVIVAHDLYSSNVQTILSVDFKEDINTK